MTLPIFQAVHRFGIHVVPGMGRHRFSLIHADDLAELLIRAGERGRRLADPREGGSSPRGRGYYFAACEEAPLYDDLGRLIAQVLGRRSVFPLHVATPLVWLLSCGFEACCQIGRQPSFLGLDKAREITAGSWTCSPEAAVRDLDFHVAAPLRERLRQTADWYRRKGWL
jgi:dihydroflavonol-4-reductase